MLGGDLAGLARLHQSIVCWRPARAHKETCQ